MNEIKEFACMVRELLRAIRAMYRCVHIMSSMPPEDLDAWRRKHSDDSLAYRTARIVKLDRIRAGRIK